MVYIGNIVLGNWPRYNGTALYAVPLEAALMFHNYTNNDEILNNHSHNTRDDGSVVIIECKYLYIAASATLYRYIEDKKNKRW